MPLVYSRPDKLNHADTILYEIYMLRFAAGRLVESDWKNPRDAWVYLEAFLIHYRNLLEFLGNEKPRPTDLHVTTIWQLANLAPPAGINEIYANGRRLWQEYEPTDGQGGGRISQYLQHCTTKRIEFKDWYVNVMYRKIEDLLPEIEKHLRPGGGQFLEPVRPVEFLGPLSASTTTSTNTAGAAIALEPDPGLT